MESITLKILASDILSTNYVDSQDCAITRALARAGRPDLQDDANQIIEKRTIECETENDFILNTKVVIRRDNEGYIKLEESVYGMYNAKLGRPYCGKLHPIQDMEFTIIF